MTKQSNIHTLAKNINTPEGKKDFITFLKKNKDSPKDLYEFDEHGDTVLHTAFKQKNYKLVHILDDNDFNLYVEDKYAQSIIDYSLRNPEEMRELFKLKNFDINKPTPYGIPINQIINYIHNGISYDHDYIESLKQIVDHPKTDINQLETKAALRPLTQALDKPRVLKTLLTNTNFKINEPDNDGNTPIIKALNKAIQDPHENRIKAIHLLTTRKDLDYTVTDEFENSLITLTERTKNPDLINLINIKTSQSLDDTWSPRGKFAVQHSTYDPARQEEIKHIFNFHMRELEKRTIDATTQKETEHTNTINFNKVSQRNLHMAIRKSDEFGLNIREADRSEILSMGTNH
ncbi:MAG: hypothetical protein GY793_02010 [Proteobacteria bacterium]|nr:hypothetical protein [Pseudomonadota bacterium]